MCEPLGQHWFVFIVISVPLLNDICNDLWSLGRRDEVISQDDNGAVKMGKSSPSSTCPHEALFNRYTRIETYLVVIMQSHFE